jgi:Arc/MetJ-type ribon-helix-helix transcriptional regulator
MVRKRKSGPKREEGYSVGVWLSQSVVDKIDKLIEETGQYRSRSEVCRQAVRDWFDMRKGKIGEAESNFKKKR